MRWSDGRADRTRLWMCVCVCAVRAVQRENVDHREVLRWSAWDRFGCSSSSVSETESGPLMHDVGFYRAIGELLHPVQEELPST